MLHYYRSGNIGIKIFDNTEYCLRPTGRCPYRNYFIVVFSFKIVWRNRNLLFLLLSKLIMICRFYFCNKFFVHPFIYRITVHVMRLLKIINCPVDSIIRRCLLHRTNHYNFHRMLRHKFFHKFYTVHPRHLYIKCHNIRIKSDYHISCLIWISRHGNDFYLRIFVKKFRQHFSKHNRIINYKNLYPPHIIPHFLCQLLPYFLKITLYFSVYRRLYILKSGAYLIYTLRRTNKKIPAVFHMVIYLFQKIKLCLILKIYHNISQKNHLKSPLKHYVIHKIKPLKDNLFSEFSAYLKLLIIYFSEILSFPSVGNTFYLFCKINPITCFLQNFH